MDIISSIKEIDTSLFLALNGAHNSFFDFIMYWAGQRITWIPLYALFLFLVWNKFGRRTWLVCAAVVVLAVVSDQLSVHAFKNYFARYRPCHNLVLQSKVHLVDGCGGTYGFVSSHAANTFALAFFLFLLFRKDNKYFGLLFLWSGLISYSRIYVGVHYPADVVVGAMLGAVVGIVIWKLWLQADKRLFPVAEL